MLLFFKKEDVAFASFYKTMATAITKGYAFDASSVTTKKTLGKDDRPPEIKGDAWTKLKKPEQQKKIEEANKVITKANELALANAKVKQIKEHLKGAGNKSVSWGGETYKVPAAG